MAARAAHPQRDPRAALPAHPPVRAGDRRRTLPFREHRQDAPAAHLPEARHAQPPRGGAARPGHRPGHAALPRAIDDGRPDPPRGWYRHGRGYPVTALAARRPGLLIVTAVFASLPPAANL